MNLSGKTVVLTGATTGIGRAAALALADQPARLVIHGPQAVREVSGLLRVFRTIKLALIYAASCRFRYSSWTSCGVL